MHVATFYKMINLVFAWCGVTLMFLGVRTMYESGYVAPEAPFGWVSGMAWASAGGIFTSCWVSYVGTRVLYQRCYNKPRWSTSKMLTLSLPLLGAACLGIVGTYVMWKHPYRLAPCDCSASEWGPRCEPCLCEEHGVCDSGTFGSGQCICDFNWAGPQCDVCGPRWKGESCDICRTGYAVTPGCMDCARGYDGEDCDTCAVGWQPWQHSSAMYPETISEDDHRHLCDECAPNHWGFNCKQCPVGNDVPHITLEKNRPIRKGTRVSDRSGSTGSVYDMQILVAGLWTHSFDYNVQNPQVLDQTRVEILYDRDSSQSDWKTFGELRGVQCNNRGVCNDDAHHQRNFPDWDKTCTPTYESCTSNEDCSVSENCKGTCQATEFPVSSLWAIKLPEGKPCSSDEDCIDRSIHLDATNATYEGGRCLARVCCKESYHGDGTCECESQFFGRVDPNLLPFRHDRVSPACDFCPGYDWLTESQKSICSGGKGTCTPGYSRNGDYLNMRCTCGNTVYIDPVTKIVDTNKIIRWYGTQCQCGDWNEDLECDTCASGYWGSKCDQCPGGSGLRACSGHGRCHGSGSNGGTGRCDCDTVEYTSWMLAPYVPRFKSEIIGYNDRGEDLTCSECAPNFWGQDCRRCDETDDIKTSELNHIFQPGGTYSLGVGMSSIEPVPVCHPDKPWQCSLACGRGGGCNWGRTGDGTCTCWSNKPLNPATWNPLDNVCIGANRYNGTLKDYTGQGEQCPAYGYCSLGDTNRETRDLCDTNQACSDMGLGTCYPWQKMDFAYRTWGFSCIPK